jgi:penicillin V acylase-like amidase (Ntn superfamily)
VSYVSAVKGIAAAAICATSTAHDSTLGVQLCRTLNFNAGMVTAAASWPRRASGDRSKKTANRTAVARRAFSGP